MMVFHELNEVFDYYVPDWDFQRTHVQEVYGYFDLSDFLAMILVILGFVLFCKIKHRWLVTAKCSFCNCFMRVWRGGLHWWFCKHCQRINGFPKDSFIFNVTSQNDKRPEPEDSIRLEKHEEDMIELQSTINNEQMPIKVRKDGHHLIFSKNDLDESSGKMDKTSTKSNFLKNFYTTERAGNTRLMNLVKKCENLQSGYERDKSSGNTRDSSIQIMRKKMLQDDVNIRLELLKTEKELYQKNKRIQKLERTIRDFKEASSRSFNQNNNSFTLRRRSSFFNSTFCRSTKDPRLTNEDTMPIQLSALEKQINQLKDGHTCEMKRREITGSEFIIEKLRELSERIVDFYYRVQRDYKELENAGSDKSPKLLSLPELARVEQSQQFEMNIMKLEASIEKEELNIYESKNLFLNSSKDQREMSTILEESDNFERSFTIHRIFTLRNNLERCQKEIERLTLENQKLQTDLENSKKSIIPDSNSQPQDKTTRSQLNSDNKNRATTRRRSSNNHAQIIKSIRSAQQPEQHPSTSTAQ